MKLLTRRGVLLEDDGQSYLAESDTDAEEVRTLRPLQAEAVTYRIAVGLRAGREVLTLRGAVPREAAARQPLCADIDGFSHKLGEKLGQSVIVENRPGAGGAIATGLVAKAAPDGYTALFTVSSYSINQALMSQLPFDTERDLKGVTLIGLPVARARLRHRPAALPELQRRGAEAHRGDPAAGGDRQDPHPPGVEPRPLPRGRASEAGHAFAAD